MRQKTSNDLRCFCRSEPLLARYGILENGDIYLHVRVYNKTKCMGRFIFNVLDWLKFCVVIVCAGTLLRSGSLAEWCWKKLKLLKLFRRID